ncbi:MAG: hypothetical protein M1834_006096 [Cirrosporium novae-zelandiae]|nr:MAG: hypothetical protein M1834_006096 [Cirrosporium novae-zelandiae]
MAPNTKSQDFKTLYNLLPHSDYEEDQPLHHFILTQHVLHRGFQAGALIGLPIGLYRLYKPTSAQSLLPKPTILCRVAGQSALIGTGLLTLGLVGRMFGREDYEWRERSWRLLENKGQMRMDDYAVGGMAVGGVGALLGKNALKGLGWKGAVGALALGDLGGTFLGFAIEGGNEHGMGKY